MSVSFTTSEGLVYSINEEGLNRIYTGDSEYATGGLYLWDAKNFHNLNSSESFHDEPFVINKTAYANNDLFYNAVKSTINSKSCVQINATGVMVTHNHTNSITVEYLYHFINPHLNVTVSVTNLSENAQLTCPAIGGLLINFNQSPSGIDYKYNQTDAFNKLNPSNYTRTYCAYLEHPGFGVSLSALNMKNIRTLPHFDWTTSSTQRTLEHHARLFVWPQSKESWKISICASTSPSMSGLLSQYKTDLISTYGGLAYTIGNRKWVYENPISNSGSNNVYRLKTDARFDSIIGAIEYSYNAVASLGDTGRANYIPDLGGYKERNNLSYHLWPRLIEDNVWVHTIYMHEQNKSVGTYSDFHLESVRTSWNLDGVIPLWPIQEAVPDSIYAASNMNWIKYKIYKIEDYEFDIFLSPNSGKCYECGLIAPKIRDILGDKSVYYGNGIDWAAPYVGFHTTAHYNNGAWFTETPQKFFELMRYIYGDIDVYTQLGNVSGTPSQSFYEYSLSNNMSLWITSSGQIASAIETQPNWIDTTYGYLYGEFSFYNIPSGTPYGIPHIEGIHAHKSRNVTFYPDITTNNSTNSGLIQFKAQTNNTSLESIKITNNCVLSYLVVHPNNYAHMSGYMDVTITQINNSTVSLNKRQHVIYSPYNTSVAASGYTNLSIPLIGSGYIDVRQLATQNGYSGPIQKADVNVYIINNTVASGGIISSRVVSCEVLGFYS